MQYGKAAFYSSNTASTNSSGYTCVNPPLKSAGISYSIVFKVDAAQTWTSFIAIINNNKLGGFLFEKGAGAVPNKLVGYGEVTGPSQYSTPKGPPVNIYAKSKTDIVTGQAYVATIVNRGPLAGQSGKRAIDLYVNGRLEATTTATGTMSAGFANASIAIGYHAWEPSSDFMSAASPEYFATRADSRGMSGSIGEFTLAQRPCPPRNA